MTWSSQLIWRDCQQLWETGSVHLIQSFLTTCSSTPVKLLWSSEMCFCSGRGRELASSVLDCLSQCASCSEWGSLCFITCITTVCSYDSVSSSLRLCAGIHKLHTGHTRASNFVWTSSYTVDSHQTTECCLIRAEPHLRRSQMCGWVTQLLVL